MFVDQLGRALQGTSGAMDAVRPRQATSSGTLRINAFATAAQEIISPLILEFLHRHPQVHVDLVTGGRLVDIAAEGFDLGVGVAELVPSDMIGVSFGRPLRFTALATPAYLEARGRPHVPPVREGWTVGWVIDANGPVTVDKASVARTAVLAGIGIGYFFEQDVRADTEARRLVRVPEGWTPPLPGLCLYYPGRRNPSASLKALALR